MYKLIILITSVIHPEKTTRVFCFIYAVVNYLFTLVVTYCGWLNEGSQFFLAVIFLECIHLFVIYKVVEPWTLKRDLTLFSLGLIIYNYYEYCFYNSYTWTYSYYTTINLVTLDLMVFFLWKGVHWRAVLSHLKGITYTTALISGGVFLWCLYSLL